MFAWLNIPYLSEIILLFVLASIFRYCISFFKKSKLNAPLPPGPMGLPILGYWPFLSDLTHYDFAKLAKKYGPIFGYYTGNVYSVVLNDYESMIESFRQPEFNGRPENGFYISENIRSIADLNRSDWDTQRHFCDVHLKDFFKNENGMSIGKALEEQVDAILQRVEATCGNPSTSLPDVLFESATNVVSEFSIGKEFNLQKPLSMDLFREYQIALLSQGVPKALTTCFPWLAPVLRKITPTLIKRDKLGKMVEQLISDEIETHEAELDPNNPKDFIDHYLLHMKRSNDPSFTKTTLNGHIQIMAIAGTDAVRSTMEWFLLCLARYPQVQERIYEEIVDVFGTEKRPDWAEKNRTPYTLAAIAELQRFKPVLPINSVRSTIADVVVKGYLIPKDTMVFANLWAISNDVTYWKDPDQYNPDRYLNKDGNFDITQRHVAFSNGKRKCPGKSHAVTEIFTFVTAIVQKYHLFPPEGGVSLEAINHLVTIPVHSFLRFEKRN